MLKYCMRFTPWYIYQGNTVIFASRFSILSLHKEEKQLHHSNHFYVSAFPYSIFGQGERGRVGSEKRLKTKDYILV